MLDFEDELTLESFRIPWLIWNQLIVLFLLLFLFYFTIFASDPSHSHDTVASNSSTIQSLANHHSTAVTVTNALHVTRGVENLRIKGDIATSASTGIVREEIAEGEASSLYFLHPCYCFKLARVPFSNVLAWILHLNSRILQPKSIGRKIKKADNENRVLIVYDIKKVSLHSE